MKGTVDRVDGGRVLTLREVITMLEVGAATELVEPPPDPRSSVRPDIGFAREFDDIPSIIRALLVGYDEV